jgi:phage shock protein PspC (stress-responsive transcriptional regulator)
MLVPVLAHRWLGWPQETRSDLHVRPTGVYLHRSMAERLPVQQRMAEQGLVRPRSGRVVTGVLVGVANRFEMRPLHVRMLFLLSLLLPGPQILAYIALWILMPSE